MLKETNAQVLKYSIDKCSKCSNAPMLTCSNTPMLKCSNAQMLKCNSEQMHLQTTHAPANSTERTETSAGTRSGRAGDLPRNFGGEGGEPNHWEVGSSCTFSGGVDVLAQSKRHIALPTPNAHNQTHKSVPIPRAAMCSSRVGERELLVGGHCRPGSVGAHDIHSGVM